MAALENTVSRMQRDLEDLQTENRFLRTPKTLVPVRLVRQAALTTTKVPWFNGSTSWEQYRQVFDAIVLSNGWGEATAALQLLSHLQEDALSVALLVPMPLRASRKALTDALSYHYGSPGRLANYRREFDKTVRKPGEDPSNFAITLKTLAVKAGGRVDKTILGFSDYYGVQFVCTKGGSYDSSRYLYREYTTYFFCWAPLPSGPVGPSWPLGQDRAVGFDRIG